MSAFEWFAGVLLGFAGIGLILTPFAVYAMANEIIAEIKLQRRKG